MSDVPETHPRYLSLMMRDRIVAGVEAGVTSIHGLIAHGRGEAFDYLIGERTHNFAMAAIAAAAAMLRSAGRPVISVNGNAAALVPSELVALGGLIGAPLEVNIFHSSKDREQAICTHLQRHGASDVLLPQTDATLDYIDSNRRFVHPEGILKADVVFVPLEDGDRCEALRKMGKDVVTVDLNPLSRTAQLASVTIVDNLVRAMPVLLESLQSMPEGACDTPMGLSHFDNASALAAAADCVRGGG